MIIQLGPTSDQIDRMRLNVLKRVHPVPAHETNRRRIGFATLSAGVLAVMIVIVGVTGPWASHGGDAAQAAEVLDAAAVATIATADPVLLPGQFLRIATTQTYRYATVPAKSGEFWMQPSTQVLYIPYDQASTWVMERHPVEPTVFYGDSKAYALDSYEQSLGDKDLDAILRATAGAFYNQSHDDLHLSEMPREPTALRQYFYDRYQGGNSSIDEDVWSRMTAVLRTGEVPADLRAALYRALALVPGVSVTDENATLGGRTGVALSRIEPNRGSFTRSEIIIDRVTGLLIGERDVQNREYKDIVPGTVTGSATIKTSVVDSTP